MRDVVDIRNLDSGLPTREPLRVLDGPDGVLGDERVESGDRGESGEAAAAETDGEGAVVAPGPRVLGSLEDVDLGEGRVVAVQQLGHQEEPHRPRPHNGQPGSTGEPAARGQDDQGQQPEDWHARPAEATVV